MNRRTVWAIALVIVGVAIPIIAAPAPFFSEKKVDNTNWPVGEWWSVDGKVWVKFYEDGRYREENFDWSRGPHVYEGHWEFVLPYWKFRNCVRVVCYQTLPASGGKYVCDYGMNKDGTIEWTTSTRKFKRKR